MVCHRAFRMHDCDNPHGRPSGTAHSRGFLKRIPPRAPVMPVFHGLACHAISFRAPHKMKPSFLEATFRARQANLERLLLPFALSLSKGEPQQKGRGRSGSRNPNTPAPESVLRTAAKKHTRYQLALPDLGAVSG